MKALERHNCTIRRNLVSLLIAKALTLPYMLDQMTKFGKNQILAG